MSRAARGALALLVLALLGLSACGGGGASTKATKATKSSDTENSDATDTDSDSSSSAKPKAPKLSKEATQLIEAIDTFNDTNIAIFAKLGTDTQAQALAEMNDDIRNLRTSQFNFDAAVREIKFPGKLTKDFNDFLTASSAYIAALDDQALSTTTDDFKAKNTVAFAAFDKDRAALATLRADVGLPARGDPRRFAPDNLPVAFSDDLSKDRGKWFHGDVGTAAGKSAGVTFFNRTGYHINSTEGSIAVAPDVKLSLGTTSVEADVTKTDGIDHPFSADGSTTEVFGVMCRVGGASAGVKTGYLFLIDSSGGYRVAVLQKDGTTNILDASRAPEPAIKTGTGAVNHVRADCVDDHFTLFVNGDPVSQVTDNQLASGNVGLFAGAFALNRSPIDVAFENVVAKGK